MRYALSRKVNEMKVTIYIRCDISYKIVVYLTFKYAEQSDPLFTEIRGGRFPSPFVAPSPLQEHISVRVLWFSATCHCLFATNSTHAEFRTSIFHFYNTQIYNVIKLTQIETFKIIVIKWTLETIVIVQLMN